MKDGFQKEKGKGQKKIETHMPIVVGNREHIRKNDKEMTEEILWCGFLFFLLSCIYFKHTL